MTDRIITGADGRYYITTEPKREQKREWVGLTDMEIVGIASLNQSSDFGFARAIEAKLKEKNT